MRDTQHDTLDVHAAHAEHHGDDAFGRGDARRRLDGAACDPEPLASHLLTRPAPLASLDWRRHVAGVTAAVGLGRIIAGGVAALAMVAVGWWLLRPPPVPLEDILPMATVPSASASASASESSASGGDGRGGSGDGSSGDLWVHVAGAVRRPGLYQHPPDARVADAIDRAGGAGGRADLDRVNLAARLTDGQQILVPRRGEPAPSATGSSGRSPGDPASSGAVDLNTADAAALDALPGVGPATAAAIIAHRDEQGPFASVDDLLDVPGIGPAKLAALRDLVTT